MGQTLTEQILSHAAGRRVRPGEMVIVEPDVVMGHDSLSPGIIEIMRGELGIEHVHDPEQIVLVMDHVAPASTVGTANNQKLVRAFAGEEGIRLFDVGRGICHQVLIEEQIGSVRVRDGVDGYCPDLGYRAHLAAGTRNTACAGAGAFAARCECQGPGIEA